MIGRAARCLALAMGLVLATDAAAHADPDDAEHGHDHGDRGPPEKPTAEQIKKRLERVKRMVEDRRDNLDQRKRDRRRAVRKRLERVLAGGPIEPAVKEELATHARRVASLRQVRYVAAVENDFDTVVAVDGLLARENNRHERWWRDQQKARVRTADAGAGR
jgi:hypothetical protein